ncbi:helix-turn-helix transcriptional regulator [Puia dinghuensis]|uniref:Transcriptional regulator n=1 Tax=Puia dinghuensis TaxID=1792502 RepID=A0A8J2UFJ7_9BACT|nr:YafY family protein [Puia dinghuensis]GGB08884.1 transcriptional regulator [Puia dinghuensis]
MNRIDRLHAILTHLQSKRKVTAQEMADRFNISLRTVYRDVKALDESGVPVIGEAGSGYTIMEGYRLPPVMFTQEEASALLLGAKLAEQFTDGSIQQHFQGALFKIKAVLRSSDKEYVDSLTEHIEILARYRPDSDSPQQYLSLLQQSIVNKKLVNIHYRSNQKEEVTRRRVEPIGLLYYGSAWHLIGWCHLRNDYRDFRLSRMLGVVMEDGAFDSTAHPSIKEYIEQIMVESDLQEAVVSFDKRIVKYLAEQKYLNGFVSEEECEAGVRMKFLVSNLRYFARWLLTYTDEVRVDSPEALKTLTQEMSEKCSAHHRSY